MGGVHLELALPPDWHLLLTFTRFFHCSCSSVPSENLCGNWTRMSFIWAVHSEFQVLCRALGKCKAPVWMYPGPLPCHWEGAPGQKGSISLKKTEFSFSFNSLVPPQCFTEQVWVSPVKRKYFLSLICIAWFLQRIFSVSFSSRQGLILLHSCL